MSQFRNGLPMPASQREELRAGESESLTYDPSDTRTPTHFTSKRDVPVYRRFIAKATFESEMKK